MNTITFIAVVAVLWAGRELIIGIFVWRSRQKFQHEIRVERTQRYFATARNELMQLAIANEIDVNSTTFRYLYFLNTLLMRRPDAYPEWSTALRITFLRPQESESDSSVEIESEKWTPAIRDVVKTTADALDSFLIDYSLAWRLVFKLKKRSEPEITPMKWHRRLAERITEAEKKTLVSDIRETRKRMYALCSA